LNSFTNNTVISDLDRAYNIYLINNKNIEDFFKQLIKAKSNCYNIQQNLKSYLFDNIIYNNPINYDYINKISEKNLLKTYIKSNLFNNTDNIKINLDILLQGTYINPIIPSCGLITTIISNNTNNTFLKFITA
jgi:hypothetical protein